MQSQQGNFERVSGKQMSFNTFPDQNEMCSQTCAKCLVIVVLKVTFHFDSTYRGNQLFSTTFYTTMFGLRKVHVAAPSKIFFGNTFCRMYLSKGFDVSLCILHVHVLFT